MISSACNLQGKFLDSSNLHVPAARQLGWLGWAFIFVFVRPSSELPDSSLRLSFTCFDEGQRSLRGASIAISVRRQAKPQPSIPARTLLSKHFTPPSSVVIKFKIHLENFQEDISKIQVDETTIIIKTHPISSHSEPETPEPLGTRETSISQSPPQLQEDKDRGQ